MNCAECMGMFVMLVFAACGLMYFCLRYLDGR